MARRVRIWTWDVGSRLVDVDGPPNLLAPILETILEGGLWNEFRKIPLDTLVRLLPRLRVSSETRRFLDVWIEEAPHRAGARRMAGRGVRAPVTARRGSKRAGRSIASPRR